MNFLNIYKNNLVLSYLFCLFIQSVFKKMLNNFLWRFQFDSVSMYWRKIKKNIVYRKNLIFPYFKSKKLIQNKIENKICWKIRVKVSHIFLIHHRCVKDDLQDVCIWGWVTLASSSHLYHHQEKSCISFNFIWMYMYACLYVCMFVCVCVFVFVIPLVLCKFIQ